jgi:hypothetical protein
VDAVEISLARRNATEAGCNLVEDVLPVLLLGAVGGFSVDVGASVVPMPGPCANVLAILILL